MNEPIVTFDNTVTVYGNTEEYSWGLEETNLMHVLIIALNTTIDTNVYHSELGVDKEGNPVFKISYNGDMTDVIVNYIIGHVLKVLTERLEDLKPVQDFENEKLAMLLVVKIISIMHSWANICKFNINQN